MAGLDSINREFLNFRTQSPSRHHCRRGHLIFYDEVLGFKQVSVKSAAAAHITMRLCDPTTKYNRNQFLEQRFSRIRLARKNQDLAWAWLSLSQTLVSNL